MNNSMLSLYKNLTLNDKRNEFSSLLLKTDKLLDQLMLNVKDDLTGEVKNYNSIDNLNLTEDDIMLFFYEDLWNIKNKILTLIVANENKEKKNE